MPQAKVDRSIKDVDTFIVSAPKEVQPKLRELRAAIREAAPTSVEGISYGIAGYDYGGRMAWFGWSKHHVGLYIRPPVIAEHRRDLAGYETTKSAVRFPLDKKIQTALVKKLIRAAMAKNKERMSKQWLLLNKTRRK